MKKLLGLVILALAFVLAWAGNVQARDTFCNSELVRGEFDNLIVLPGGDCVVVDSIIHGNAVVERLGPSRPFIPTVPAGKLTLINTTVGGNVEGGLTSQLVIRGSRIGGNVKCDQTTFFRLLVDDELMECEIGGKCGCVVDDSSVQGNVQVRSPNGVENGADTRN